MEKKQYKVCIEVLRRLKLFGVLPQMVLIGSWCIPFYKEYLGGNISPIRTRDLDFLVPTPVKTNKIVDIPDLLKDLGFIQEIGYPQGYMKLIHPELIVEFLVPERGRGIDRPYQLPQFGVNAQALRFLDLLLQNTIVVEFGGIHIVLPHPACFAVHKLVVSLRRANADKSEKDRNVAISILKILLKKEQKENVAEAFNGLPSRWQNKVITLLERLGESEILEGFGLSTKSE